MESMGIIGFIFGLSGLSFALIGKEQIAKSTQELEDLRRELVETGALKQQPNSKESKIDI